MAYDEGLAQRIREVLAGRSDVTEKRMFGGIAFMVRGNMACGIVGDELMLRLGDEGAAAALEEPHTRAMDFTGRSMKSMLYVEPEGFEEDEELEAWVGRAVAFAGSLPEK